MEPGAEERAANEEREEGRAVILIGEETDLAGVDDSIEDGVGQAIDDQRVRDRVQDPLRDPALR